MSSKISKAVVRGKAKYEDAKRARRTARDPRLGAIEAEFNRMDDESRGQIVRLAKILAEPRPPAEQLAAEKAEQDRKAAEDAAERDREETERRNRSYAEQLVECEPVCSTAAKLVHHCTAPHGAWPSTTALRKIRGVLREALGSDDATGRLIDIATQPNNVGFLAALELVERQHPGIAIMMNFSGPSAETDPRGYCWIDASTHSDARTAERFAHNYRPDGYIVLGMLGIALELAAAKAAAHEEAEAA